MGFFGSVLVEMYPRLALSTRRTWNNLSLRQVCLRQSAPPHIRLVSAIVIAIYTFLLRPEIRLDKTSFIRGKILVSSPCTFDQFEQVSTG